MGIELIILLLVIAFVWRTRSAAGFMFLLFLGMAATVILGAIAYHRASSPPMVAKNDDEIVHAYLQAKERIGPPTTERAEDPRTLDDMWDDLTGSKIALDKPAIPITREAPSAADAERAAPRLPAATPSGSSAEDQAAAQLLAYLIMQAANSQAGAQNAAEAQTTRDAAVHVSQLLLQAAKSDAGQQAADAAKVAGEKALDAVKVAKSLSVLLNTADQYQALMADSPSTTPSQAVTAPPSSAETAVPTAEVADPFSPDGKTVKVEYESSHVSVDDPFGEAEPDYSAKSNEPRPDWLDNEDRVMRNSRELVLTAGPYATAQEVRQDLEQQLAQATMRRLSQMPEASTLKTARFDSLHVPMSELLDMVFVDEHSETSTSPSFVGDMKTTHLLVEFDAESEKKLSSAWKEQSRRDGIKLVGQAAGGALGILAMAAGLLRLDTWTRGYYTKRLFLGVPAAIIAGVVALKAAMVGW